MCVDWLRACYASEWLLCRGSTIRTPGRYYFAPEGTPFYAGVHNLGSKQWHDKNWGTIQGLGEALDTRFQFIDGTAPEILPSDNIQLGNSQCIAGGENPLRLLSGDDVFNGFPVACFLETTSPSMTWEKASSYDSCSIQAAWAQIIDWAYGADVPSITAFLSTFLGPAWTIRFELGGGNIPNMVTAVAGDGAIVWITGTDNFQQAAFQAADSVAGPRDIGRFSTSQFWYNGSDFVILALNAAGADPAAPIMLAGHSYGGVLAVLSAARFKLGQPSRAVRWITYGQPRPGDIRLTSILGTCPGIALCNDNDLIASIPPDLTDLLPALALVFAPQFLVWPAWKSSPYQARQDPAGRLTRGATPTIDTAFVVEIITEILANVDHPQLVGHLLETYIERIKARCPAEEWPLKPGDYTKLFGDVFIAQENTYLILQEISARILTE